MNSAKTIKKVSLKPAFHIRFFKRQLFKLLSKLNKHIRNKNYPLLACIPSDFIGQNIVIDGLYEESLLLNLFNIIFTDFLPSFKEKSVIDGGANIGNHSLFFSRYFKQVIAFEPNPTALSLLRTNIFLNKVNNIEIIPVGLSDQSDMLPFAEYADNLGRSSFYFDPKKLSSNHPIKQLQVDRGDVLLEQIGKLLPVALIKLDIEGAELSALYGLAHTINQFSPIILFESLTSQGKQGSQVIFEHLRKMHNYQYFYTLETYRSPSFIVRLFKRSFSRPSIVLKQIQAPKDRYYPLIIATIKPLF